MDRLTAWLAQAWMNVQNAVLAAVRWALFPHPFPEAPRTLVVFRVGNIGDTITALPALAAIRRRFPESRMLFMTSPGPAKLPGARELLEGSTLFDEMINYTEQDKATWRGKMALLKRLRSAKPEGYIELSMALATFTVSLRNMVFARCTGAPALLGGRISVPSFGRRSHARVYPQLHDAVRTMNLLAPLRLPPSPYDFPLPRSPEGQARATTLTAPLRRPLVAFCPGGKREINRWPVERFGQVAARLVERCGAGVVVIGGPGDQPLYKSIRDACPSAASAVGFNLRETAELLRLANLLVTNDTGPMHLAAAVGTPVVAIFAARDYPNSWYPYGGQHSVLRREVPCACCFLEQCPTMHCNRDITVDEVTATCQRRLQELSQDTAPKKQLPSRQA